MARDFNGTTDYVAMAVGALSTGYGSLAVVCRIDGDGVAESPLASDSYRLQKTTGDLLRAVYGAGVTATSLGVVTADGWVILAVTKATGSVAPVFHKYVFTTNAWTHETAPSAVADGGAYTAVRFGMQPSASTPFNGKAAGGAIWNRALSNAEVEQLAGSWRTWAELAPDALWVLDQWDVAMALNDWTAGGANQNGISGTAVATVDAPVGYGAPIRRVLFQPAAAAVVAHQLVNAGLVNRGLVNGGLVS